MGSESSGTEAGYNFAQSRNLTRFDLQHYNGRSQSFADGMEQYVTEQEELEKNKTKQQK